MTPRWAVAGLVAVLALSACGGKDEIAVRSIVSPPTTDQPTDNTIELTPVEPTTSTTAAPRPPTTRSPDLVPREPLCNHCGGPSTAIPVDGLAGELPAQCTGPVPRWLADTMKAAVGEFALGKGALLFGGDRKFPAPWNPGYWDVWYVAAPVRSGTYDGDVAGWAFIHRSDSSQSPRASDLYALPGTAADSVETEPTARPSYLSIDENEVGRLVDCLP